MSAPFKAPEPEHMEPHDQYLRRTVRALEDWANTLAGFKPESIDLPKQCDHEGAYRLNALEAKCPKCGKVKAITNWPASLS